MYEAEIKFAVDDPTAVRDFFDQLTKGEVEVYEDTYLVQETLVPPGSERELRIREVRGASGTKSALTFKDNVVDEATSSKEEHEINLSDASAALSLLLALGFRIDIQFTKNCTNWKFERNGRTILATLATVPEIAGHFLEVETIVPTVTDVTPAIDTLRQLAQQAGLGMECETTATYTESVRSSRSSSN